MGDHSTKHPSPIAPTRRWITRTWIQWPLLIGLTLALLWLNLFLNFQGLSSARGMEQAQLARELARGHGMHTKVIRPLIAARQIDRFGPEVASLRDMRDSYQGPLGPIVSGILLRMLVTDYKATKGTIYFPDRVIAFSGCLFFLFGVAMSGALAYRLFDRKIAIATALSIVVCSLWWDFARSGLPHGLALALFCLGLLLLFESISVWRKGGVPLLPLILSAGCFGLLTMALPPALGIAIGALIFVSWEFRKRWLNPVFFALAMITVLLPWFFWNTKTEGMLFGAATYDLFAAPGGADAVPGDRIMRNWRPGSETLPLLDLVNKVVSGIIYHICNFWRYLGGSIAAPLFFIALLHPFREKKTAAFRWAILAMWIGAGIGMSIVGTSEGAMDERQLHALFLPVATAYGLAMLSVIWSRITQTQPKNIWWKEAHLFGAIALAALPMLSSLHRNGQGQPPLHDPAAISMIRDWTTNDQLVFSDAPWAVAWYADRPSAWLPLDGEQLPKMAVRWQAEGGDVAGLYLSPHALHSDLLAGDYREWWRIMQQGTAQKFGADLMSGMSAGPFKYWQNLSPHPTHQAWFVASEPLWDGKVPKVGMTSLPPTK